MKNIHKYIMLFVMAFAVASCADDEIIENKNLGKSGDEVQFGLSLDNGSRTVYGEEANNAFPIYWVNGDKVQIFSPQCLEGRRNAEYKVTVSGETQNYADNIEKTGAVGIQWGAETADFYSLYPSGNYSLSDEDENVVDNVVINYSQSIQVSTKNDKQVIKSDMEDCLMYARTTGVEVGKTVNLQYEPISTVVYLTLKVAENEDVVADNFTIQSISLFAPDSVNIAGTFSLDITNGKFVDFAEGSASNKVMAQISNVTTGGFHTITNNETFSIPLFLAPVPDLNVNGWQVQVVANNNVYTKTLGDKNIVAGQIHKITLPELKPATTEWDVSSWMKYIPRNVYLSEISIPGTWNSLNVDCQSDTSIKNQYGKGVRAFHIDTRWRVDNTPGLNVGDNPSFTGIWGDDPDITELSVATGGSNTTYKCDGGNLMRKKSALTFSEYLAQVTGEVKDDEYMVVFCTFSQNSYNGDRCPSTWYEAISTACDGNEKVYDASSLTSNTVVGDVLGHVIVVVNLDTSVSSATLPADSKCLFTYVTMLLPENHYAETTSHIDGLHYSTGDESGISMYTSHAQISTTNTSAVNCGDRGYSHLLTNRDNLVKSFWDWSMSNYGTANYNHDKWIYLGLGGYILNSNGGNGSGYDTIENRYGPMVYNRINEMGKNNVPFYPIGIILMNNKKGSNYTDGSTNLNYGFSDVCKNILLLNNKYRLQYDATKPTDYTPNDSQGGEGGDAM